MAAGLVAEFPDVHLKDFNPGEEEWKQVGAGQRLMKFCREIQGVERGKLSGGSRKRYS
jgi:hypothetical protein